jgi:rRNA pseudouridine-1189 N-methylase Emg1 (Nep1/Mra1 family)
MLALEMELVLLQMFAIVHQVILETPATFISVLENSQMIQVYVHLVEDVLV